MSPEERIAAIEASRLVQWTEHFRSHEKFDTEIANKFNSIQTQLDAGHEEFKGLRASCQSMEIMLRNHCNGASPSCKPDPDDRDIVIRVKNAGKLLAFATGILAAVVYLIQQL